MNTTLSNNNKTITIDHGPTIIPTFISIINTLPKGSGDIIVASGFAEQERHPEYVLEFKEPSAKIVDASFEINDPTTMYTFGAGKEDLVFHRHAGRRAITGITGSEGALMKFSYVSHEDLALDPELFIKNMVYVYIPGDSQFVLKFDGQVYHQFGPIHEHHNGFFAVSVHPEEDQNLEGDTLHKVHHGEASIPLLTEPVLQHVIEMLSQEDVEKNIQKIHLSTV